jgi:hypothetical protein
VEGQSVGANAVWPACPFPKSMASVTRCMRALLRRLASLVCVRVARWGRSAEAMLALPRMHAAASPLTSQARISCDS